MLFLGPFPEAVWGIGAGGDQDILDLLSKLLTRTGRVRVDGQRIVMVSPHLLAESPFWRNLLESAQHADGEKVNDAPAGPWASYPSRKEHLAQKASPSWIRAEESGLIIELDALRPDERMVLMAELYIAIRPPEAPSIVFLPFEPGAGTPTAPRHNLAHLEAGYLVSDLSTQALERIFDSARVWLPDAPLRQFRPIDTDLWGVVVDTDKTDDLLAQVLTIPDRLQCEVAGGRLERIRLTRESAADLSRRSPELAGAVIRTVADLDDRAYPTFPAEATEEIAALFVTLADGDGVIDVAEITEKIAEKLAIAVEGPQSYFNWNRVRLALLVELHRHLDPDPLEFRIHPWGHTVAAGLRPPAVINQAITLEALGPTLNRLADLGQAIGAAVVDCRFER